MERASVIVDIDGRVLTQPARGEALILARVDLARARDKAFGARNDVLRDRRPELYGPIATRAVDDGAVLRSSAHAGVG